MLDLKKGDRVRHAEFGEGTVVTKLIAQRARVVFDAAPLLPRIVRRWDLESLDEAAAPATAPDPSLAPPPALPAPLPTASPRGARRLELRPPERETSASAPLLAVSGHDSPGPAPSCTLDRATAWQTLEALRLGVVPSSGVQAYTVGREREMRDLQAVFNAGRGCRVLWGDYGAGKTHLLEAAEQLALDLGYATARITLDPTEQALHHPLRLYRHIVESVRTRDQHAAGFEEIFEALADSPPHYHPNGKHLSRFFSSYLHTLRTGDVEMIGWLRDYVRGDNIDAGDINYFLQKMGWSGPRALRMSDFRTYGRMYIHLVGTLAAWCADAGAQGLVLFFDEVERVDTLSPDNQKYAFEVLQHYAAVTMNPDHLGFDPESLYKGGQSVHRAIPLKFRDDQPLITVFALTPLEEIREAFKTLTSSGRYDVDLPPLGDDLLDELLDRIAAVYERAYPGYSVAGTTRDRIGKEIRLSSSEGHDSFRDAVRAAVFLLDGDRMANRIRAAE